MMHDAHTFGTTKSVTQVQKEDINGVINLHMTIMKQLLPT